MSYYLAGFFSALGFVAIPVLVRFVKDGFRAGVSFNDDLP